MQYSFHEGDALHGGLDIPIAFSGKSTVVCRNRSGWIYEFRAKVLTDSDRQKGGSAVPKMGTTEPHFTAY